MNPSFNQTNLVYLSNTYLFEHKAQYLGFGKDSRGSYVILDETIFHPQGGGQPSDIGTMKINENLLNVFFVSFNCGIVYHYVKEEDILPELKPNTNCSMKIDSEKRLEYAKCHTAGHLISSIVRKIAPELIVIKSYHFPDGPSIDFSGELTSLNPEEFERQIKRIIEEKVGTDTEVISNENVEDEALSKKFREQGMKARTVTIGGFEARPCSGTHLKNLSEIKNMTVRKIKIKKDNIKIGYSCY